MQQVLPQHTTQSAKGNAVLTGMLWFKLRERPTVKTQCDRILSIYLACIFTKNMKTKWQKLGGGEKSKIQKCQIIPLVLCSRIRPFAQMSFVLQQSSLFNGNKMHLKLSLITNLTMTLMCRNNRKLFIMIQCQWLNICHALSREEKKYSGYYTCYNKIKKSHITAEQ